jgi:hypothetical protein
VLSYNPATRQTESHEKPVMPPIEQTIDDGTRAIGISN